MEVPTVGMLAVLLLALLPPSLSLPVDEDMQRQAYGYSPGGIGKQIEIIRKIEKKLIELSINGNHGN